MNLTEVKTKIAKLLRLQTSNNVGEAANAAAFVEKLCVKYNVSSTDCTDFSEKDEVVEFQFGKSYYKADIPLQNLIHGVSKYFNGTCIISQENIDLPYYMDKQRRVVKVIASQGNKIQIELYLEYLVETMNKLAKEAKKSGGRGTSLRTYSANWKKGFSKRIADRLLAMKNEQKRVGKPDLNESALVILNKNAIEQKATQAFLDEKYPSRTKSRRSSRSGVGYSDGSTKAESIGLNKQTGESQQTLALTGN